MKNLFALAWIMLFSSYLQADTYDLSYAGRLTKPDGTPIAGLIDLKIDFYRAEDATEAIDEGLTLPEIKLMEGVFQVTMSLEGTRVQEIFNGKDPVWIGIIANGITYPKQRYTYTPFAFKIPVDDDSVTYDSSGKLTLGSEYKNRSAASVQVDTGGNAAVSGQFQANILQSESVNGTAVTATDVNATDVNATDINATDINATNLNATTVNTNRIKTSNTVTFILPTEIEADKQLATDADGKMYWREDDEVLNSNDSVKDLTDGVLSETRIDSSIARKVDLTPVGSIIAFAGVTPPTGWLLCDGTAVTQAAYPELSLALGNSLATFNLPDLRGRMIVMENNDGAGANKITSATFGDAIGEEEHTLTTAETPVKSHDHGFTTDAGGVHSHSATNSSAGARSHSHGGATVSDGVHNHHIWNYSGYDGYAGAVAWGTTTGVASTDNYVPGTSYIITTYTGSGGSHAHGINSDSEPNHTHTITVDNSASHTHTGTTAASSNSSADAFKITPPSLVLKYIIKAKTVD